MRDIFNERRTVASFTHRACGDGTSCDNAMTIRNGFETPERIERASSACGIECAGFEDFMPEANGTAILFNNAIGSRLIDGCDLKANRVTSGIDDCKCV